MSQMISQSPPQPRTHLAFLDGLRGLSALYVVLHHVWQFAALSNSTKTVPAWFKILAVFKFGSYGVAVFIVLSGYCLMLPVVQVGQRSVRGGPLEFWKRRARRILPPYYACLVLSSLLIIVFPQLQQPTGILWDITLPALTKGSLLTHALLVHNIFYQWRWSINGPLWSVALEWQIYFIFVFVLLPAWRKLGNKGVIAAAIAIAGVLYLLGFHYASPWFISLFAFGMVAATLNFSVTKSDTVTGRKWIRASGIILLFLFVVSLLLSRQETPLKAAVLDSVAGLATALFIGGYRYRLQYQEETPVITKLLTNRNVVRMGKFSYSLYLIHYPLLAIFYLSVLKFNFPPAVNFAICITVYVPAVVVIAYLFHRAFERPFMRPVNQ